MILSLKNGSNPLSETASIFNANLRSQAVFHFTFICPQCSPKKKRRIKPVEHILNETTTSLKL